MHEFTYNKSFPFHQIEIVEETTEKIYSVLILGKYNAKVKFLSQDADLMVLIVDFLVFIGKLIR